jgi:hypothetical protein
MVRVGKQELLSNIQSFQKDKILGPTGFLVELILGCFDFIGDDLRRVVEATIINGKMLESFNITFLALIPKDANPKSFGKFRSISLYNYIYKIISKVIARRLKRIMLGKISEEQFGFLKGRQIHEAIGIAQEGLHSIKIMNQRLMVIKVDLYKAGMIG